MRHCLYLPKAEDTLKDQLINPKPQLELHRDNSIMRVFPPTEENKISIFLMSSVKLQNFKK